MQHQRKKKLILYVCLLGVLIPVGCDLIRTAMNLVGNTLVERQIKEGPDAGTWPDEQGFTGVIVAGLVDNYEKLGNEEYLTAAVLGGQYILSLSGNFYGDEAYALSRLSAMEPDPQNNAWRSAVYGFYQWVRSVEPEGMAGYIDGFADTDPSNAVFYMAHHNLAASYIDDPEKTLFRQRLINYLSEIDDDIAYYPVMSLGLATWSLAQTGPMDSTPVRPKGPAYWNTVTLADLPGLLLEHQVPTGQDYAGSFFWRYDHDDGDPGNTWPVSGYSEDAFFATMAIGAIAQVDPNPLYDDVILDARSALLQHVDNAGLVYEHLWLGGYQYYAYAGEMLQALYAVDDSSVDLDNAVGWIAEMLVAEQVEVTWPGEIDYTGSIVAGLVDAYNITGNVNYKSAAQLGGDYIVGLSENFYGDEAYALARLSDISNDPSNNAWRDALTGFYDWIRLSEPGGMTGYIDSFANIDSSNAVFYLAHHVLASHYVNDIDKALFRERLINHLSQVDDGVANYPVLGLGVAAWALAQTGPLDSTSVRPQGPARWDNVTLRDLPGLLLDHQVVPTSEPNDDLGSFYWRFDHTDGDPSNDWPVSGYSEDAIYATLGIVAAAHADASEDYDAAILAARSAFSESVDPDGFVHEHIWLKGQRYDAYAGEMLQALSAVTPAGDLDGDADVDIVDLSTFAEHWLETECAYPDWGGGADLNHNGVVDLVDFAILSHNWFKYVE